MRLNFRQYAEAGPPVVILHGLFGSLNNFGWHCKQLAESFAVISADLRNHGDSPHAESMDYESMAADVRELLDTLGIQSCALVGHSMGGKVAMQLALSEPGRVNRLAVVDIAPVTYGGQDDGHLRIMQAMHGLPLETLSSRGEAESLLADDIRDEATRRFILTNLTRAEGGGYAWRLNLESIENNYELLREKPKGVGPYEQPALFIRGEKSRYIERQHEALIRTLFPNASIQTVKGAGHWVHAEQPLAFQSLLREFLQREDKD